VQLSSPHCAPCRATSAVLAGVAAEVPGVRHRELDISDNPDLIGALDVLSTPTTLVVDGAGRVRNRAVGTPSKQAILQVVRSLAGAPDAPNAGNSLP
jgi:thiol-disulfide isomerase/thioredoxin